MEINNIYFENEYTFSDLKNPKTNHKLRFDFAIKNNDKIQCLIEYDGEQHFYYTDGAVTWNTKESFYNRKERDNIKNNYCIQKNIKLYRIPYFDIDKINNLEDIFQDKYEVGGTEA